MEKDIVTRESIKRDNRFWVEWIKFNLCIFLILLVGLLYIFSTASPEKLKAPILLATTIFLICMSIGALCGLIYCVYMHLKHRKDFIIVKDIFASMTSRVDFRDKEIRFFPEYMCFRTYGNFPLRYSTFSDKGEDFYSWSKYNHMWYDGLKRTSVPGDEFYLVIYKKRILAVYNTKLFELSKDLKVTE